ncbi:MULTISPECIES: hypothetical protein [Bacteroides]|jgi:hypothetical protein|uniref:hypothetical protein n=1 Tax=Bacteroidales TaxID=171549 RepID=UPI00189FA4E0|nr:MULTISPECIES: hypothetical protein [Bacteroides]MBO1692437.1 hypothetical protein [Bacteroides uniformis]
MKRERNIITIDERGRLNIPTDTVSVWMTEAEIVELFGTTAAAVHTGIKTIFKENVLHDYEVCKCIRLDSGNSADVYNMEVVVALAFRIRSQGATKLREYILRTLGAVDKQPAINILMACTRKTSGHSQRIFN